MARKRAEWGKGKTKSNAGKREKAELRIWNRSPGTAPEPAADPAADRFLDALFSDEYALPGLDDEPALDALFTDEYVFPGLDDEPAVDAELEQTIAAKIAGLGW